MLLVVIWNMTFRIHNVSSVPLGAYQGMVIEFLCGQWKKTKNPCLENFLSMTTITTATRKPYQKILECGWDYIAISHVCLTGFFLSEGNCAEYFIWSLKDLDKRKRKLQFLPQKDRWRKQAALKKIHKVIIFSRVLWKSSLVLGFVAEQSDVSVAVRSQAPRLPISRGAVRVLKRPSSPERTAGTCSGPSLPYKKEVRLLFPLIYWKVLHCLFFL